MNPSEDHSIPTRVGQIAVPVADVDRAVDFYGNVLGLRLLFRAPPGLAFFDCGGVRLMLSQPEGQAAPSKAGIIYYLVADIAAAYARLRERGVEFLEPPRCITRLSDHDLWIAVCHDSEQNPLGLMSEVRPPAS